MLAEEPTDNPPPDTEMATPCTHPGRFMNGSLTQGGGVYTNSVTSSGGITNINNPNNLVDVDNIDPMGPDAWATLWYSDFTENHYVEACSGDIFYLNVQGKSLYSNPPYQCRIWVDWNNNGDFSESEIVYTSPLHTGGTNITFSNIPIQVPAGQPHGNYRMRIRWKDNSPFVDSDNACTYGNPNGTVAPYGGYNGSSSGYNYMSDEIEEYRVTISCGNDSGGGDITYQWEPADSVDDPTSPAATATPTETTTYTVTVTDTENDCVGTYQVTVVVEPEEEPTFDPIDPICIGDDAPTLPATSLEGITGTWSPAMVSNTETGTYTFIPDEGQCALETEIEVVVNPLPDIDAGPDQEICEGESVTLQASGGVTYTWDNGVVDGQEFIPTGAGTYTVTGVDENGCENTDEMSISIAPVITFDLSSENPDCGETDGSITISGLEPNETYEFTYNHNGTSQGPTPITTDGSGAYTIEDLGQGTYSDFLIENDDVCSEADPASITLTEEGAPDVEASENVTICLGEEVTISATYSDGATISWSPDVVEDEAFTPTEAGTFTYTVTATISDCSATDQVTITVNPLPEVDAGDDQEICDGGSVTLTASGAETYTWDNGVVDGEAFSPTETTTYTVIGIDANGCENTDEITVTVIPPFTFELDKVDASCGEMDGEIIISDLSPSTTYTLVYDNGGVTQAEQTVTTNANGEVVLSNLGQGVYANFVLTEGECNSTNPGPIQINEEGAPSVTAPDNVVICIGESVTLTADNPDNATLSWTGNIVDGQEFTPTTAGTTVYVVTVTEDGCSASD